VQRQRRSHRKIADPPWRENVVDIANQEPGGRPVNRWLSNMFPMGRHVHFAYTLLNSIDDYSVVFKNPDANVQQHTAYQPDSGAFLNKDVPIVDGGVAANAIDGFFSTDEDQILYYVSVSRGKTLVLFASRDHGATREALTQISLPDGFDPYAIGTTRQPDQQGTVLGTLTMLDNFLDVTAAAQTWMFSLSTTQSAIRLARSDACRLRGGAGLRLRSPISPQGGHRYATELPELQGEADTLATPRRSPYLLCEDGQLMREAHSLHDDILRLGGGRFWSVALAHCGTGYQGQIIRQLASGSAVSRG
jgi:hypothetical protein